MNKRVEWIDFIKGFLILCVVLLHVCSGYTSSKLVIKMISCFSMLSFFSISGFLTDYKKESSFIIFFKKKFKTLIIPYIVWGGIIGIPFEIIRHILQGQKINILYYLKGYILFNNSYSPTWFLGTLFFIFILSYFLHKIIKKENIILLIDFFFMIIGLLLSTDFNMFFKLKTMLVSIFFFQFGNFIKNYNIHKKKIIYGIILLIIGIIFTYCNDKVVVSKALFGNYIYFFISTISIITGIYIILSKINLKNTFIHYFGKYSIIVLCTHQIIIYSIRIIEKVMHLEIHTIPIIPSYMYTCVISYFLIKLLKKYMWFTFGIKPKT